MLKKDLLNSFKKANRKTAMEKKSKSQEENTPCFYCSETYESTTKAEG